jgi:ribonuclease Z
LTKRLGIAALCLVLLLAGAAALVVMNSERAQDALLRRAAAARVAHPRNYLYSPDSLDLVFCGTGSPLADRDRGQACIGVFAGGRFYLIDAGTGGAERLNRYQVPLAGLDGVLLTHFHSDHIGGLGEIVLQSWAAGRATPLKVYGPPGVARVTAGFQEAYALDSADRTAHHGAAILPPAGARLEPIGIDIPPDRESVTVLEEGGLRIRAFRVDHGPVKPAYGYRVDYRGRSAVFSGDTVKVAAMARVGKGADVMVHEALSDGMIRLLADVLEESGDARRARILRDTPSYHTTPVEAAELANEAGVQLLVYSHVLPPLPNRVAERMFLRGVARKRPRGTLLAHDGLHLELPVGSRAISTEGGAAVRARGGAWRPPRILSHPPRGRPPLSCSRPDPARRRRRSPSCIGAGARARRRPARRTRSPPRGRRRPPRDRAR